MFTARNSGEIKKATIIGNPMYSTEDQPQEENSTDLAGLDGLQLDMDYDQIMHYFENLKVNIIFSNRSLQLKLSTKMLQTILFQLLVFKFYSAKI